MDDICLQNKNEEILVNIMEEFVKIHAKKTLKELGCCQCNTCFLNACALALNNLNSKYVTTNRGALLSQITATELKNRTDILVEVAKAVMKVKQHPHHNSK